jgi:hypothetical protein
MRLAQLAKMNVLDWLAILKPIAILVGDVVEAVKDGRVDPDEIRKIGEGLIEIVAAVVGPHAAGG